MTKEEIYELIKNSSLSAKEMNWLSANIINHSHDKSLAEFLERKDNEQRRH